MAMDNTTRATVLKYESNEWARVWKEKLIEHKYDIEQSLLSLPNMHLQNIITFGINNGITEKVIIIIELQFIKIM